MELIDGRPEFKRQLVLKLRGEPLVIAVESWEIAFLLNQLPAVEVLRDPGPSDSGPASGSGYVFVLADGATSSDVVERSPHSNQSWTLISPSFRLVQLTSKNISELRFCGRTTSQVRR